MNFIGNWHPIAERMLVTVKTLAVLVRARLRARFYRAALRYVREADRLIRCHGVSMAAKILKAYFGQAKRVAFGYKDGFVEYPVWAKCDTRTQLPHKLGPIKHYLHGSIVKRIFALSVFASYLIIRTRPVLDTRSITAPWKGKGRPRQLLYFVEEVFVPWLFSLGFPKFRPPKDLFLYRSGVWRQPCVSGVIYDSFYFIKEHVRGSRVTKGVVAFLRVFGGHKAAIDVARRMLNCKARPPLKEEEWSFFRTSAVSDRGGKTRVFTCASYWIQFALYPLHTLCMELLRKIPEDYTYRHDAATNVLRDWHKKGYPVWSYDLTNATDRFPLWIQCILLDAMFPNKLLGVYWGDIMRAWSRVDPPWNPDEAEETAKSKFRKKRPEFVSYQTGQPMGVYSSWPVFALTHHMVIRFCAWRLGLDPTGLYAVLGDDVAIANKRLAREYYRLVTKWLGVAISLPKSYAPVPEDNVNAGEFAKQLVSNGRPITPLTPDLLEELSGRGWHLIADVVDHVQRLWWFKWGNDHTSLPLLIETALGRSRLRRAVWHLAWPGRPLMPGYYLDERTRPAERAWTLPEWWPCVPDLVWYDHRREEALARNLSQILVEKELLHPDLVAEIETIPTEVELVDFFVKNRFHLPYSRLVARTYWKIYAPHITTNLLSLESHVRVLESITDKYFGARTELEQRIARTHASRFHSFGKRKAPAGFTKHRAKNALHATIKNRLIDLGFWRISHL